MLWCIVPCPMTGRSDLETLSDDRAVEQSGRQLSLAIDESSANLRPLSKVFYLMWLIDFAAFALLIPILSFFLIHEIGLGPESVGQLLSAFSLAQFVGAWACGRISDATGRRSVIIVVMVWAGVGYGATAFVTTVFQAFVVRVMQGLSGGTLALLDAYVLDSVPRGEAASYIGFVRAVKGVSFAVGAAISALLIRIGISRRTMFLISGGLTFLAAGTGLASLDESLAKRKRKPLCAVDWGGINMGLLCAWLTRFMSALAYGVMFPTYPFLVNENFGWSDKEFGVILFVGGLCSAIFQLLVFPRMAKLVGVVLCLCVGAAFGIAAFALLPEESLFVHIVALAFFYSSAGLVEPSIPVLIGLFADERHLGLANGIAASCRALATMLSPLVAGILYKQGPRYAYFSAAACFIFVALTSAVVSVLSRSTNCEADRFMPEGNTNEPA